MGSRWRYLQADCWSKAFQENLACIAWVLCIAAGIKHWQGGWAAVSLALFALSMPIHRESWGQVAYFVVLRLIRLYSRVIGWFRLYGDLMESLSAPLVVAVALALFTLFAFKIVADKEDPNLSGWRDRSQNSAIPKAHNAQ